jgi:serine/threonine protein kinase
MATVYRGEHVSGIGMVAAVKKLHPHLAVDEELRARLKVEAQALARLKHKNIVQIFDYVDLDGNCALVTELVEGRTLRSVMAEFTDWPMPLSMALRLFRQILEGVSHAHRHNCLHRDLKPGNIMVTKDNEVKILDFGIANLIDTEAITRTGVSIGTPVYMAPEQLEGRRDLDQRADLYSLGMTLWEMLAGHGARPIGERGWRLGEEDIESLLAREVPPSVIDVVHRLVQVNREERYMSCESVLEALSDLVEGGCLDEESRIALAGVAPAIPSSELPTFEFEATAVLGEVGPVNQTLIEQAASSLSNLSKGTLFASAVVIVAVGSHLYQLPGDQDQSQNADPTPTEQVSPAVISVATLEPVTEQTADTLSLLLVSEPTGATLLLDGEELGNETLIKKVQAEERDYLLTAELQGYHDGSMLCRVGAEAIEKGSLRCVVSLRAVALSKPAIPDRVSQGGRPVESSSRAKEETKTLEEIDEKPTIHKID